MPHDAVGDCLASQVLGRPVSDVQSLGDRLRTGQFDDLGSLQGGNLLRPPQPGVVRQELLQPALPVAATDPPDGGPIPFRPGGDGLDRFAGSDGQDDSSVLNLKPSQASVVSHGVQDGEVGIGDGHRARLTSPHENTSDARAGLSPAYSFALNLLHDFCPGPLVPLFDAEGFAEAACGVLDDPAAFRPLGREARRRIE